MPARGNLGDQNTTEALPLDALHDLVDDWENLRQLCRHRVPHRDVFIIEARQIAYCEIWLDVVVANPYVPHLRVGRVICRPTEIKLAEQFRMANQTVPQGLDIEIVSDKTEIGHALSGSYATKAIWAKAALIAAIARSSFCSSLVSHWASTPVKGETLLRT